MIIPVTLKIAGSDFYSHEEHGAADGYSMTRAVCL